MTELLRTRDPALVGLVEGLLADAGIRSAVADRHAHTLEGGIGVFPLRVLVPDDDAATARSLLEEAGLGEWLR